MAGYRIYRRLAPGPWFNSTASPAEYERLYRAEILAPLNPRDVAAELEAVEHPRAARLLERLRERRERRSTANQSSPPAWPAADRETHLLFQRAQVEHAISSHDSVTSKSGTLRTNCIAWLGVAAEADRKRHERTDPWRGRAADRRLQLLPRANRHRRGPKIQQSANLTQSGIMQRLSKLRLIQARGFMPPIVTPARAALTTNAPTVVTV